MNIRNKKTGKFIQGTEVVDGKVVIHWTEDQRQAEHFPSNLPRGWAEGFKSFQKNSGLELEVV